MVQDTPIILKSSLSPTFTKEKHLSPKSLNFTLISSDGSKKHRIVKPATIRRLARSGGLKKLSKLVIEEARHALKTYLKVVIHAAAMHAEHPHRNTVTASDVQHALKLHGHTVYGFD